MSPVSTPSSDTDYSAARRGAECAPPCQLQPRHATNAEVQRALPNATRHDDARTRSLIGQISNNVRGGQDRHFNATPTAEDEYDTMLLGLNEALAAVGTSPTQLTARDMLIELTSSEMLRCDAVQSDCVMRNLLPNYLQTRPPLAGDDPIGDVDALDNGWYLRRSERLRQRRLQESGHEASAPSLVQQPALFVSTKKPLRT
ncbi:hypothetical protein R3P38DRAFT_2799451 [Favolaschia claudopus]|uniref:Uncharacterized protein n=1 Tax=Favolaschia claudopus TaxID=2862362 RepID=A0AAV9ZZR3_9AGAR